MSDYRKGFCVEMVTSGCKCQPLSVYESTHMGDDDFHNMTEGVGLHGVGGVEDCEGICPECEHPVHYNRYLVVTEVPPAKPAQTEMERELLATLKVIRDDLLTLDSGDVGNGGDGWRHMAATLVDQLISGSFRVAHDAISKAERQAD